MTKRPASTRVRDVFLALVALVALLGLAIVVVAAPKQADAPASAPSTPVSATTPVSTEAVDDASPAASRGSTLRGTPSPSPRTPRSPGASPVPKASPAPTPRSTGSSPERAVAKIVSCAEVTPGPASVRCVTRKRKRTVVLGGLGAPVGLSGAVVSVQQVDVVDSGRRGVVRLRLRGGISLPPAARGVLRRSKYYFGAGERRFRAVGEGTGLRAPTVGKGSRYRVAFDLPRATFERVSQPGVSSRFVWAPPGVAVLGMEPVGVVVMNLSAAIR